MYIYNVTINVEYEVHDPWLAWMRKEHIPEMLSTGKFSKALLLKVLVEEETGGTTYSVQYFTKNKQILEKYYEEDAPKMRKKSGPFEGKYVAFRTELEIIDEF